jgi:methyl-accepting chemotaxis protein
MNHVQLKHHKDIKNFKYKFIFATEGISYFILVPIIPLYIWINLNLTNAQILLLLKFTAISIVISMITTNLWDLVVVSPVTGYFDKLSRGEIISESEYIRAQKRFFALPFLHSIGSFFRWIFGLGMAIIPFTIFSDATRMQVVNIWLTAVMIPPLNMFLFFLLTEGFIQNLLNKGYFAKNVDVKMYLNFSFLKRILASIFIIAIIPAIAISGTFMTIIDSLDKSYSFPAGKVIGVFVFCIIVAMSVSVALTKTIQDKIHIISGFLTKVGDGDLSSETMIMAVMDDLARINQSIYVMKKNITDIISDISGISGTLEQSTEEISSITESFTADTQSQAATVEEVTATMEEISASMDNISHSAQNQLDRLQSLLSRIDELSSTIIEMEKQISEAHTQTEGIAAEARTGEKSLSEMNGIMGRISESSHQMTSIIGIISDISDRINLLSLNAAIEAARAGDAGRGFAVVADEISKLADSTASSVKEIDTLIKGNEVEIERGIASVGNVVASISRITGGVTSMTGMVSRISDFMKKQVDTNRMVGAEAETVRTKSEEIELATKEQKNAMSEVVISVNKINELTQSISAGSEEIAANTRENAGMADMLKSKVDRFKLA